MNTLTIKLPAHLEAALAQACEEAQTTKSEVVRQAIAAYLSQRQGDADFISALDKAGELVGCFEGGPADLSSNPVHLADFGRV